MRGWLYFYNALLYLYNKWVATHAIIFVQVCSYARVIDCIATSE